MIPWGSFTVRSGLKSLEVLQLGLKLWEVLQKLQEGLQLGQDRNYGNMTEILGSFAVRSRLKSG